MIACGNEHFRIIRNLPQAGPPYYIRLNNQERRVDALALRADERRDKLRKALGSCK